MFYGVGLCWVVPPNKIHKSHSEIDQIHLSIEAQCGTACLPIGKKSEDIYIDNFSFPCLQNNEDAVVTVHLKYFFFIFNSSLENYVWQGLNQFQEIE